MSKPQPGDEGWQLEYTDRMEGPGLRVRSLKVENEEVLRAVCQELVKRDLATEAEAQETFLAGRAALANGPVTVDIEMPATLDR